MQPNKGISTKKGVPAKSKTNQDAYITVTRIFSHLHVHFFAVCDGHGQNGSLVSTFIKSELPTHLLTLLHPHLTSSAVPPSIASILKSAFLLTNASLLGCSFDTNFSGSTCNSVLVIGRHLF